MQLAWLNPGEKFVLPMSGSDRPWTRGRRSVEPNRRSHVTCVRGGDIIFLPVKTQVYPIYTGPQALQRNKPRPKKRKTSAT